MTRRWNMLQKQPWHKLSQLIGARGVKADWTGFPDRLLKPTNDLAETHPCGGRCGGYMDVVRHGDGTFVGVCPSGCDKRALQKKDLIVYRPDFTAIFSGLAQAFGINGVAHAEVDGLPACWQIGEYNPAASYRFPVVAMVEAQTGRIERAIGQLAARYNNPFFVLLPSAPAVTQTVQDVALRNGAKVFAYEDMIEFANDSIQVRGNASAILSELATGWIKNIDGAAGETRYPTPAGATWGDIVLEFTADEMVTVSCKNQGHKQYSAEDFQMRDKRTKKPKKSWAFLQALAVASGNMSVADIEKVKKTKQEVSANLQRLFQLPDDDPIEWVNEDTAYKTKFIIRGGDKLTLAGKRQKTAAA
ncbi:MAG: hypothetical protein DYH13_03525 [Alphaproteobacteria bacterium PRO2]|nr:hypothetical protein [Alphaproteobacteria bacterium PRO2]